MNQFGTVSKLFITVQKAKDSSKTVLSDCYFTAPFKVMKPFPRDDGGLIIFQQTASAGIMAGDEQEHKFIIKEGATLELISQSFEKIFKMENKENAHRDINATIEKNATLYYTPLPCIPFEGSDFFSKSTINLEDESSRLVYEDCICCGRKGHGEEFDYRKYHNVINIFRNNRIIYHDNTLFLGSDNNLYPQRKTLLKSDAMYGEYSHLGTMILVGFNKTAKEINTILGEQEKLLYTKDSIKEKINILAGITTINSGDILIRVLGNSAEDIQNFFLPLKTFLLKKKPE